MSDDGRSAFDRWRRPNRAERADHEEATQAIAADRAQDRRRGRRSRSLGRSLAAGAGACIDPRIGGLRHGTGVAAGRLLWRDAFRSETFLAPRDVSFRFDVQRLAGSMLFGVSVGIATRAEDGLF